MRGTLIGQAALGAVGIVLIWLSVADVRPGIWGVIGGSLIVIGATIAIVRHVRTRRRRSERH